MYPPCTPHRQTLTAYQPPRIWQDATYTSANCSGGIAAPEEWQDRLTRFHLYREEPTHAEAPILVEDWPVGEPVKVR